MLRKVLIANRGEIACRIIRTCHRLGVATVAVYSDVDRDALHVSLAGEAVHIGPSAAAESYLRGDTIIEAALRTGADAIHPGYGFLSENPDFADAVTSAGIRFIGPSSDAIRAMGLKDAAKALMEKAGVPVVPGYHGAEQDPDFLLGEAERIGFPVLIKARAGGGGKGMRRVENSEAFRKRSPRRNAKLRPPLVILPASSRNTSPIRAISRSRCLAMTTAMSCTSSSATARSSAAIRRS